MPANAPLHSKPSLGGLYVKTGEKQLVFPLKHTKVLSKIAGNLSRVEVTQTFENPFTEPLEAIYVFPLPDEAAVDDMEIKIGERVIKGNIKKREEAKEIYEQARREGRTAGLLEQERDNIFTQSLANIKPGEAIDVTIRYTDSLKFTGGDYEFVFPMVVGPRFIPGTPIDESGDTDQVPDASRITPPVIPPETRSGHDIGVTVEIDAGVPVRNVRSTSHQLTIEQDGQIVRVKLGKEDTIPNKDLIVRYQVSSDNTQATVLSQSDQRGGHFAVYLIPALDYRSNEIVPKDVVFLMDTSGSQHGDPLLKSQELMRRFINGLNPDDTFTIIDFSDTTTQLSTHPLPNTAQNRTKAINYINQLQANGGTYLLNGIRAVLNFPAAPAGRLRSIVLLTDGYIGNDNEILAEVQQKLQPGNRLYSFGVGSSPNRFLLNRIAEIGRGTSQIVRHNEPIEDVAEKFFRQINNPVLTNIQVAFEGTGEAVIYPSAPPDLFTQEPLVLFGRVSPLPEDDSVGTLRVTGTAARGTRYEKTFNLNFEKAGNPAIAQLWGRARIKYLMQQMFGYETKTGVEAVTNTALMYQLLSQYTAFVAVSDDVRVDPERESISMQVPVEMPQGVSYQGIFGSANVSGIQLQRAKLRAYGLAAPKFESFAAPEQECLDALDTTLIDPGMIDDEEVTLIGQMIDDEDLSSSRSVRSNAQLQVVIVTGLDQAAVADLTRHLQQLNLPSGFSGEIVFEFVVNKGRVGRIVLDEEASTLTELAVIERIKRSLISWRVPQSATGTVCLTLRIQT
ncbi:after-VIT domain-containing protein [Microcoleus sp. FACHB-SPT15]|nr:after-VIT domain-containing protein [Microcoleus sp. FACHB-SPT15]